MKINRDISILVTIVVFATLTHTAHAQTPSRVIALIRQSDFIGFVQANPNISVSKPGETQWVDIYGTDLLKGDVKHDYGNGFQYPWMHTEGLNRAGYTTWFAEKGEYLVFGRVEGKDADTRLLALAAFPVLYRPDDSGVIASSLFGDIHALPALSREQTKLVLEDAIQGTIAPPESAKTLVSSLRDETGSEFVTGGTQSFLAGAIQDGVVMMEAVDELDAYLDASRNVLPTLQSVHTPTFEEREAEAKQLASLIRVGTTREQIEKVFPESDGGAFASNGWRYYLGSEVMVGVPYDTTGGAFSKTNLVNGPITVYRSSMHYDWNNGLSAPCPPI